jgi:hypothetical protein
MPKKANIVRKRGRPPKKTKPSAPAPSSASAAAATATAAVVRRNTRQRTSSRISSSAACLVSHLEVSQEEQAKNDLATNIIYNLAHDDDNNNNNMNLVSHLAVSQEEQAKKDLASTNNIYNLAHGDDDDNNDDDMNDNNDSGNNNDNERVFLPSNNEAAACPLHVDVSNQTAFYQSIDIIPPYEEYCFRNTSMTSPNEKRHELSLSTKSKGKTKTNHNKSKKLWRLNLGDAVIVHSDAAWCPANKATIMPKDDHTGNDAKNFYAWYPFQVPWSPAEVVSIYRTHPYDKIVELRKKLDEEIMNKKNSKRPSSEAIPDSNVGVDGGGRGDHRHPSIEDEDDVPAQGGEIMVEVRWLYRSGEVPVLSQSSQHQRFIGTKRDGNGNGNGTQTVTVTEEVYETDHVDACSTLSLLAPLVLLQSSDLDFTATGTDTGTDTAIGGDTKMTSPARKKRASQKGTLALTKQHEHEDGVHAVFQELNMPRTEFFCHRFWSVRRRTLMPVGSSANRVPRGWLYSREIQRSHAFQMALVKRWAELHHHGHRDMNMNSAIMMSPDSTTGSMDTRAFENALSPTEAFMRANEGGKAKARRAKQHSKVQAEALFSLSHTHTHHNNSAAQQAKQRLRDASSIFMLSNCALDAHQKGFALRGREKEQRRLRNFIRAALHSSTGSTSNSIMGKTTSSTMFCAGPVSS